MGSGQVGMDVYKWAVGRGGGYMRLNAAAGRRKRVRLARLGSGRRSSLRGLRIGRRRLRLKIKLSWFSPLFLLAKLRDAYVHFMQAASRKLALSEPAFSFGPFPALPYQTSSSVPFPDLKAKDRELNQLIQLYLARTRAQLVLAALDAA